MPRNLLALLVVATAASACTHNARQDRDPFVVEGVERYRGWLKRLPVCARSAEATAATSLGPGAGAIAVAVRGLLALTANPTCMKMKCEGENACCNRCFAAWVLVPSATDGSTHEIAIQKTGDEAPMAVSMQDCKLGPFRQQLPKAEVIVSGWLEDEGGQQRITRASICVVEQKPPTSTQP
jgi:hypothetical protein